MTNKVINISQRRSKSKLSDQGSANEEVYLDIALMSNQINNEIFNVSSKDDVIKKYEKKLVPDGYLGGFLQQENDSAITLSNDIITVFTGNDLKQIREDVDNINQLCADSQLSPLLAEHNVAKNTNLAAVQNALHNCFRWQKGERILLPEFGSNLRTLLYNGITEENIELVAAEIRNCVSEWEPRVVIDKIINRTTTNDKENNEVHLDIIYHVKGLSDAQYNYKYHYTRI